MVPDPVRAGLAEPASRVAVERLLTSRLLSFVEMTGIGPVLADRGRFSFEEAVTALQERLSFALDDPLRARMIRVLLDFLCECRCLRRAGDRFSWDGRVEVSPAAGEAERVRATHGGHLAFFEECLHYAPRFLQGAPPLFDFSARSTRSWERLLGNGEFAFARAVLARLLLPRDRRSCEALVLCYGPGFDLLEIERRRPATRVTALDFTDAFHDAASGRLAAPERVTWTEATHWGGFGHRLPYDAGRFDVVLFSCADPYIPPASREIVYRDVFRILRPGGAVGILTHSYPDVERRAVADEWIRLGTFCHDFLESVCTGWQGFRDAAESRELFARVGFRVDVLTLNGSVWRLLKPPADDAQVRATGDTR